MTKRKFTILGGDARNLELARLLLEDKNDVCIFGFDKIDHELREENDLYAAIKSSDIIIGPLPFTNDNVNINTPLNSDNIKITNIFSMIDKTQLLLGGKINKELQKSIDNLDIRCLDYFDREELQVQNAIPTAEGAIQIAMEEMPITLHNSDVFVLGFGRVGKALAKMLNGIGANVYVAARKYSDLAWINSMGYKSISIKNIETAINKMDFIFNTIPSKILDENILRHIDKDALIIDLASKPGGVDFEKAKEMNLNTIWALALPGKVAPRTAAMITKDTIYNMIEEMEE